MSDPEGKFKTDVDQAVDDVQAVADRLRAKLESDEAATVGFVRIPIFVIGCILCLLFGFIAGHIR